MSNIQKIAVNRYYVWVDKDAEIKEDCYALHLGVLGEIEIVTANGQCKLDKKIIAASPELNLEKVPTYVEWLAEKEYEEQSRSFEDSTEMFPFDDSVLLKTGFIKGYQTAEKELPTWDDVRKAIDLALTSKYEYKLEFYSDDEIIEQLKQSKQ